MFRRRRFSYANITATLAVVLALGGTSYAAVSVTGQQVKNGTLTGADVRDGSLRETDLAAGAGIRVHKFAGLVQTLKGGSGSFVFAGPTTEITTDADDRVTGTASAPLGLTKSSQTADVGLCYRSTSTRAPAPVVNFEIGNFATHFFSTTRETYAAASSTKPGAGTWTVGFCVRNKGPEPINNNNLVNGWVMVHSES